MAKIKILIVCLHSISFATGFRIVSSLWKKKKKTPFSNNSTIIALGQKKWHLSQLLLLKKIAYIVKNWLCVLKREPSFTKKTQWKIAPRPSLNLRKTLIYVIQENCTNLNWEIKSNFEKKKIYVIRRTFTFKYITNGNLRGMQQEIGKFQALKNRT